MLYGIITNRHILSRSTAISKSVLRIRNSLSFLFPKILYTWLNHCLDFGHYRYAGRIMYVLNSVTVSQREYWETWKGIIGGFRVVTCYYDILKTFFLDCFTLGKDGANGLSRNVGNYQRTLRNDTEQRRSQLHRGGSLMSRMMKTTELRILIFQAVP